MKGQRQPTADRHRIFDLPLQIRDRPIALHLAGGPGVHRVHGGHCLSGVAKLTVLALRKVGDSVWPQLIKTAGAVIAAFPDHVLDLRVRRTEGVREIAVGKPPAEQRLSIVADLPAGFVVREIGEVGMRQAVAADFVASRGDRLEVRQRQIVWPSDCSRVHVERTGQAVCGHHLGGRRGRGPAVVEGDAHHGLPGTQDQGLGRCRPWDRFAVGFDIGIGRRGGDGLRRGFLVGGGAERDAASGDQHADRDEHAGRGEPSGHAAVRGRALRRNSLHHSADLSCARKPGQPHRPGRNGFEDRQPP